MPLLCSTLVVLAGLGLVAVSSVVARVLAHGLELALTQPTPEHLRMALARVVHRGLHSPCMVTQ